VKFYIVEWHHATEQEGERAAFTSQAKAIRHAESVDVPNDPDWYARPMVYRVTVKPTRWNVAHLAAGFRQGLWEVVWDAPLAAREAPR
jgi:hypothetical protein